jgi:hypothetical protein
MLSNVRMMMIKIIIVKLIIDSNAALCEYRRMFV